jgi:hypothetical protein
MTPDIDITAREAASAALAILEERFSDDYETAMAAARAVADLLRDGRLVQRRAQSRGDL